MIPSQMWKGILDGCVLKVISRKETYGYEISEALKAFGFTEIAEGTPLNHGQIVSAWAHWKQTKGNKNFRPGGPGVYRSLVWYKTQVEYGTFYTQ